MAKTVRGRPPLDIPLERLIQTVRRHGQVVSAARGLGCSPAYVHKRLKLAGLSVVRILDCLETGC